MNATILFDDLIQPVSESDIRYWWPIHSYCPDWTTLSTAFLLVPNTHCLNTARSKCRRSPSAQCLRPRYHISDEFVGRVPYPFQVAPGTHWTLSIIQHTRRTSVSTPSFCFTAWINGSYVRPNCELFLWAFWTPGLEWSATVFLLSIAINFLSRSTHFTAPLYILHFIPTISHIAQHNRLTGYNRLSNRMTYLLIITLAPSPIPSQIPHTLFDTISHGVDAVSCHDQDTCKTVHTCARSIMP